MIFSKPLTISCPSIQSHFRNYCLTSPPPKEPTVTIIDACTRVGRILSLLLKQNPLIGELRLYDKNSSVGGLGEDLSHIDTRTKLKSFGGQAVLKYAISDADIVVSVGGSRASYRETSVQSFEKNLDDIRNAALHLIEFNPKAIFCIAKPPVEAFVPLVSEEFKKAGVYDSRKIIGVSSLGTMRANAIIGNHSGQNASDILCPIIGGLSNQCVVAVLSQTKPKGLNLSKTVQSAISNCEDDVLKLYADCGKIYMTHALATSRFINILLKAVKGETNCVDCAFVRQTGHIGQFLPYMTSIIRLGRYGVMSSHMPKISGEEAFLLKKASVAIKQLIQMGEAFVTGKTNSKGKEASCQDRLKEMPKKLHVNASVAKGDKPVLKTC